MKVSYIELLGQKHPLCFSATAAEEMDEAFGGLDALSEQLAACGIAHASRTVSQALEILLKAGRIYADMSGMAVPDPLPCAVADLISITDKKVMTAILSAVSVDTEREVETVPKNGEATQGL